MSSTSFRRGRHRRRPSRQARRRSAPVTVLSAALAVALGLATVALAPAAVAAPAAPAAGSHGTSPAAGSDATATAAGSDGSANAPYGQGQAQAPGPGPDGAAAGALAPRVAPVGVHGPDVASFQHPGDAAINWSAVKASGSSFTIIKATEGTGYTNPFFASDWAKAAGAGLVRGAYHYARPSTAPGSAAAQAAYFLRATGNTLHGGMLAPFLDLEETGGLTPVQLGAWTSAFLHTVETATGRTPYMYTYRSFWQNAMSDTTAFHAYPLWFASYTGTASSGPVPGGWSGWRLWQYTSSATSAGILGRVDMSVFCCGSGALSAAADGRTEIARRWGSDAVARSLVGNATGPEGPAAGGGRWQPYQAGGMTWSVATGARLVYGGIGAKYLQLGGSRTALKLPAGDETDTYGGRQQVFQGGRIFSVWGAGTHEVQGAILGRFLQLGGTAGALGGPVSDEHAVAGGRQSDFQHGSLRWDASTGAVSELPR